MQVHSHPIDLAYVNSHTSRDGGDATFLQHSQSGHYSPNQAGPSGTSFEREHQPSLGAPCNHGFTRPGFCPCSSQADVHCLDEASIELREIGARREDGRESGPLGALDALRVASALEDFLRMLGLHEQLHVIPSSRLLGSCKGALAVPQESSDSEPARNECRGDMADLNAGRQLHVHRVLPSGRSVALSVSS